MLGYNTLTAAGVIMAQTKCEVQPGGDFFSFFLCRSTINRQHPATSAVKQAVAAVEIE